MQITDQHFYSGGGRIIAVKDLATAFAAMDETVEQGEGAGAVQVWDGDRDVFHPERDEVAHYSGTQIGLAISPGRYTAVRAQRRSDIDRLDRCLADAYQPTDL